MPTAIAILLYVAWRVLVPSFLMLWGVNFILWGLGHDGLPLNSYTVLGVIMFRLALPVTRSEPAELKVIPLTDKGREAIKRALDKNNDSDGNSPPGN